MGCIKDAFDELENKNIKVPYPKGTLVRLITTDETACILTVQGSINETPLYGATTNGKDILYIQPYEFELLSLDESFAYEKLVRAVLKDEPKNEFKDIVKEEIVNALDNQEGLLKGDSVEDLGAHYRYSYKGVKLDVYRILSVYQQTDPAIQHAIKKLLRSGKSIKSLKQDIQEVILTLNRKLEMMEEDDET